MGSCMSAEKKSDAYLTQNQHKVVRCITQPPSIYEKQTNEKNSPQSARLARMRSKLPPLKKGIEQRQKLIAKSSTSSKENSSDKRNGKGVKILPNVQNKILQMNLKKQLQQSQAQILRQKFTTLSTLENLSNDDGKCQTQNKKYLSQINSNNNLRDQTKNKQHNQNFSYAIKNNKLNEHKENIMSFVK